MLEDEVGGSCSPEGQLHVVDFGSVLQWPDTLEE